MAEKRFSERIGVVREEPPITVREDATPYLRYSVSAEATNHGAAADDQRHAICRLLHVLPDSDNWSPGNVLWETKNHLEACPWYLVYDFAEEMHAKLVRSRRADSAKAYEASLNEICVATGIGWHMVNGRFVSRGDAPFEATVQRAIATVAATRHVTASRELAEAITDLSRRHPRPDKTGAIRHAMAAVECLAREQVGDTGPTLGDLIKRYRERLGIPRPLDQALEKVWGYTSETARHVKEGAEEPGWPETQLVVALSAALCAYLVRNDAPDDAPIVAEPPPDKNNDPDEIPF